MDEKQLKELENRFKRFSMPFHIGVYLAINAIRDSFLLLDGPNCVIPKIEYIYGNHDLNSNIFSPDGSSRILYTMSLPSKQKLNPELKLEILLPLFANSSKYGAVFVSGQPFHNLTGMDYEGIAASVKTKSPIGVIPPKSMEFDWLEGYSIALEVAAGLLSYGKELKKNTAAIVGYLFDRNEKDHTANIMELKRLLSLCGLDLICVFPGGDSFDNLSKAAEAEYIISFPYGRKAAQAIASKSGAKIIETEIPIGFAGTTEWLQKICEETGRNLPNTVPEEERSSKIQYLKIASLLRHKPVVFAGDPYLFNAIFSFCEELVMRPECAILNCSPQKLKNISRHTLFEPTTGEALETIAELQGFEKPELLIGNSFANTEGFAPGIPFLELGFPSYSHHCLIDEPFMGYAGAVSLIGRLINSQLEEKR